ncbi:Asp23/Gls24 family envelope stress response protein [Alkalibaculum sp. M08DMB]|uniref:Asp23/Gls24 family envelope stress response protein n=1 Tax=Alkalibaculum sporogenes TaxID=2655001 RepID=A0A6A7K9B5_9FIRM|nr:Asp23/Gls24 family envelope stress response protein [Alkalibaculum sporogenes]MPW26040.1 Asp23/Gls24 family envelope stress response protein [Alkalibaculum sporogenes]
MVSKIYNELGYINIAEGVIANIAGLSAMECYGLVGMASKRSTDGFVDLLKGENLKKGVKITKHENRVIIDLYVIIEYGVKISVVAENIIGKVKYNVEKQTGLSVEKINVIVESVRV